MVLPMLAIYTALSVVPTVLSVVNSLNRWRGLSPVWGTFNDFAYYHQLIHDPTILTGLENCARAFVLLAAVSIPVALGLSFILSRHVRGASFFRTVFFIPQITSVVLIGLIFQLFFSSDAGLNGILRSLG